VTNETPIPDPSGSPDEPTRVFGSPESPEVVPVPVAPVAGPLPTASRGTPVVAAVAGLLVVAVAFGGGFLAGRGTAPGGTTAVASTAPSASPGPQESAAPSPAPGSSALAGLPTDGKRLGRADAAVVVEYWSDYTCPFCARFAQDVLPQLADRIADGTVAVVHRDFAFLRQESYDAAAAARCADREDRYWPMHDALYAAQQGEAAGPLSSERLTALAGAIGLDAAAFSACMAERAVLVEVLAETAAGGRVGVDSTPIIDVNGTRFRGVPAVADLLAAVDAAAAGASPAPLPSVAPLPDPWADVETVGRTAGAADAQVTVELWVDYQAAGIPAVGQSLEPALFDRVQDGSVRLVRYDLALLGEESETAAAAVRCVERIGESGWFVHDILGASGGQGTNQGLFVAENLLRFATRLRLDVEAFDACLLDPSVVEDVRSETARGVELGYETAPVVVVRAGDREVERFTGTIDTEAVLAAVAAAAR